MKLTGPYYPTHHAIPQVGMKLSDIRKMVLARRDRNFKKLKTRWTTLAIVSMIFFSAPILYAVFA